MRLQRLFARSLGIEQAVVESVWFDTAVDGFVVVVRLHRRAQRRCGLCRRRCAGYDRGRGGPRRWRGLDLGRVRCFISAELGRVCCPDHGVVTAWVPWARHGAGHTLDFDRETAWLATRMSKTAVAARLRIGWATVGQIITRVMADIEAKAGDRWAGVRRIGIDEISYRRGYKFLTVVVDHDSRRLLWIDEGRSKATLAKFFQQLGPTRCAAIELVSADGAEWIFNAVREHCPNADICLDPFHVVAWASKALDDIRRRVWATARRAGDTTAASDVKGARFALWKNPEDLTDRQRATLATIAQTNEPLYRAYLLKEQLRLVFAASGGAERASLLDAWLDWASRSQLPAFTDLARKIKTYFRTDIVNTLTHRLSNGLIESSNTKIRLLTRIAFGFRNVAALIALTKLHLGGYQITLPGRT